MGGEFNPGDLLPSENVLSTQYHTSRETVRKSLNILEKEGFIYSRAGKGSYISVSYTHLTLPTNLEV